jgi:hypothetical protein
MDVVIKLGFGHSTMILHQGSKKLKNQGQRTCSKLLVLSCELLVLLKIVINFFKKNFKIDSVIFLLKILENQIILKIFKQLESTFVLEILKKNSNNPESNLVLRFLNLFKQRELDVP